MGLVFSCLLIRFSRTFFHLFIFSTDIKYLEHKMTNFPLQPPHFAAIWELLKLFATYSPVSLVKRSYGSVVLLTRGKLLLQHGATVGAGRQLPPGPSSCRWG